MSLKIKAFCVSLVKKGAAYYTASMERFLIFSFLIFLTILYLLLTFFNYEQLNRKTDFIFQLQMQHTASLFSTISSTQLTARPSDSLKPIQVYLENESNLAYQIWDTNTHNIILESSNSPNPPFHPAKEGFSTLKTSDGEEWFIYSTNDQKKHTLTNIGVKESEKTEMDLEGLFHDLPMIFLFYILTGISSVVIIRLSFRHLRKLAEALKERKPDNLKPILTTHVSLETKPLIDSINHLFHEIDAARQREKNFSTDAAHELRTPLAALKMQVEVAMRIKDEKERFTALANILAAANRCTRVVEQLLTLSKLDPQEKLRDPITFNLNLVIEEVLADIAILAVKKEILFEFEPSEQPAFISGNATALSILIRNLVDNAIRYSPTHSSIQVATQIKSDHIELHVIDNGPGVPEKDMTRLFDRFFRVEGNKETGTGLGLAIVKHIAALHNARIEIKKTQGSTGLHVTVYFPEL